VEFARDGVARGQFGVNRIVKLTGISKATYYASQNPEERFETKYLEIKAKVVAILDKDSSYGIKRIKAELEDSYQIEIGRDTLGKLLKLWGLDLKRTIKTKRPNMIQRILLAMAERTNLLIRSSITRPFQALSSDITELRFKGGKAYLCVHKDVFGQMVYGWSLGLTMKTGLVIKSLEMAKIILKKLMGKAKDKDEYKPILHQDRGTQYTSHGYVQKALEWTTLSYSNPGTPTHNPGQESFFGRFKDQWKDEIAEIETFEQLTIFVQNKINYYNQERRHTSIGLISPYTFTKSFLEKTKSWFG
jgi:putative transposase